MDENLITQSELQTFAPKLDLSAYNATTISGLISRASRKVKQYCHVDGFFKTSVTSEKDRALINPQGELVISFRRRPVQPGDVSAIRLVTVDVEQELTLETVNGDGYYYQIPDPKTYLVYPSNFLISHGTGLISLESADLFYEIDYTGGYATDIADIPDDLKEATTLFVQATLARDLNPSGASSWTQGRVSMGFGGNKNGKNQFIQEAESILDQGGYVRVVH